jgi:hypothetical protein
MPLHPHHLFEVGFEGYPRPFGTGRRDCGLPCPKCGTTMMLTRIEPDTPGHDRRTFECAECENSETVFANFR